MFDSICTQGTNLLALAPCFGRRIVHQLQPLIAKKAEQIYFIIAADGKWQTPMNISDVLYAFSNEYISWAYFLIDFPASLLCD